jgi:hypothetical protein
VWSHGFGVPLWHSEDDKTHGYRCCFLLCGLQNSRSSRTTVNEIFSKADHTIASMRRTTALLAWCAICLVAATKLETADCRCV